jgi:hypothetical protein
VCDLKIVAAVGVRQPNLRHELGFVGGHYRFVHGINDTLAVGRNLRRADTFWFSPASPASKFVALEQRRTTVRLIEKQTFLKRKISYFDFLLRLIFERFFVNCNLLRFNRNNEKAAFDYQTPLIIISTNSYRISFTVSFQCELQPFFPF